MGSIASTNMTDLVPDSESTAQAAGQGPKFYLCGFPILHSASPSFHNHIFSLLGNGGHYSLHSTSKVTPKVLELLRDPDCGGSSITMPIKTAIIPYLDGLTPEALATGAVNTVVPVYDHSVTPPVRQLIGTNTDFLGVRNALLRSLRLQHPTLTISAEDTYEHGTGSAMVVGGGATTRSAVYALHTLGLAPIFLVNRDVEEITAVMESFPKLVDEGRLIHLDSVEKVESYLVSGDNNVAPLLMAVGAIPAISPKTPAERLVYTVVTSVFTIPYAASPSKPSLPSASLPTPPLPTPTRSLPLPTRPLFLDMAYKPRLTPLLRIADALCWEPIGGVQAMIEQGLAQQRMWKAADARREVGSDSAGLGAEIDRAARVLVEEMGDVKVVGVEVDLALGVDAAVIGK